MRCRRGARGALAALGAVLALVLAACTTGLCARNSDCAVGQVCTIAGQCAVPDDAGSDGAADAAGSGKLGDAAGPDAPVASSNAP
jgi:hypothetical protein